MRRRVLTFLALAVFFLSIFSPYAWAEFKKTKIAVLDFQLHGEGYETRDMGKIVAEWLITALVKEGRFDVIERMLLEKVLSEQKLGSSGLVDEDSASKIGRVLGAKVVITGSVMRFQNVMEVNARIIDVQSSSVIAAERVKASSAVKLEDLVVQMAEKIIKDFPLEGYIVQRDGETVLIDLGKRTGVRNGMQFVVFKEGSVIKHPKTGEVLDIERIKTGTIEIKSVKDKIAEAVVQGETSPGAVAYGQMVKSSAEVDTSYTVPKEPLREEKAGREEKAPLDASALLASINRNVAEIKQLMEAGNRQWKVKYKETIRQVRALEDKMKNSPEVYLAYAKVYRAIDEPGHAVKYAEKALTMSPQHLEALVFKGDVLFEETMKLKPEIRLKKGRPLDAIKAYDSAVKATKDPGGQSALYLRIGDIYSDIMEDKEKAKEYWKLSASAAPGSDTSKTAGERLKGK